MKKFEGFYKGINLGGWFSQCDYSDNVLNNFILEDDIVRIASWGADHVRIPIDYNIIQNNDGSFIPDGFAHIDRAIEMCMKHHLNIVLDLHKTIGYSFDEGESESGFFDDKKLQEYFYSLWCELAGRYGKYHDKIAFELLNEVTDKSFIDSWNRISNECIRRIRKIAADTIILVGSYNNNDANAVKDLDAPYDDKVVYNMHCYEPLKFTHQGATWTERIVPEERLSFEQSNTNEEYFIELFASACESAKKNNTILYCGEYGVINIVSTEDTLKWYRTINAVFEKLGIGRCAWNYKELDFGLSDEHMSSITPEIIKYL